MIAGERAVEEVCRWACGCSMSQAGRWLDLAAEHAMAEGADAAVRLGAVVEHYLAVARSASA